MTRLVVNFALRHSILITDRVDRGHQQPDPVYISNKRSALEDCSDTGECTMRDAELGENGHAHTNQECREISLKGNDTLLSTATSHRNKSQEATAWSMPFPKWPEIKETFSKPRTTFCVDDHALSPGSHASTSHHHIVFIRQPLSRVRTAIISTCFILASVCAFYETSREPAPHRAPISAKTDDALSRLEMLQHTARVITPPFIFIAATTVIYHLQADCHFQDHFVLVGLVSGAAAGMFKYHDLQDAMLRVVPWGVIAALCGSMAMHRAWAHPNEGLDTYGILV